MDPTIAEVAVNVPIPKLFHYRIPETLSGRISLGHRVLVPFGSRTTTGICVRFPEASDIPELKPISSILHPDCRFDAHLLELTRWIADYYRASWGEVLEAALPPPIRSAREERRTAWISPLRPEVEMLAEARRLESDGKRGGGKPRSRILVFLAQNREPIPRGELLKTTKSTKDALGWVIENGWASTEPGRFRDRVQAEDIDALSGRPADVLHPDQEAALAAVQAAVEAGGFRAILIHGVTGSGKTEVYLRALRESVRRGRRGLVLVPEISLTPQIVLRFRQGLPGQKIAVVHSMQTWTERAREWREIQEGRADVVIGPRSAVFAPVRDLGLIVVDEEHDGSYKQDSSPRYSGRDVAVMRARMLGIPVLLGSATPSLESYHNAHTGKYALVDMPRRVTAQELPIVTVVPLTGDFYRPDGSGLISDHLDRLIRQRLRAKEQVLIFLNRRGFATFLHCVRCGFVLKCRECDITLTFHKAEHVARCHYCGFSTQLPPSCPDCDMPGLRRSGVGTEKVVAEMARRYEEARTARLDRDTVTSQTAMLRTIGRFARGEFDILVGTQMVAKGHDFPQVTLVGVINADTGLHFPDFRAAERTFQLITQVAGRAGRGDRAGRVIVQTFFPDHFAVRCAASGDFREFSRRELGFRKTLGYPPYGRLAKVLIQGPDQDAVAQEAARIAEVLRERPGARILGPVPAPIARIQGKHRHQILLKGSSIGALHALLVHLEERAPGRRSGVERIVDVDPQSVL